MRRMSPRCPTPIPLVAALSTVALLGVAGPAEAGGAARSVRVVVAVTEGGVSSIVSARESLESLDVLDSTHGTDGTIEAVGPSGTHRLRFADPRRRHLDTLSPAGAAEGRVAFRPDGAFVVHVPLDATELRVTGLGDAAAIPLPRPAELPPESEVVPRDPGEIEVVTLRESGPPDARQDIVFLADGYLEGDLQVFLADADRVLARMEEIEPYGRYLPLVNVHAVFIGSVEAGADHPEAEPPTFAETALGCSYGAFGIDRLLDCDAASVLSLAGEAPGDDVRLVLVNDDAYGGSGGQDYAVSFTGPLMEPVAIHELGHTDAFLADEYESGATWPGGGPDYANCSRYSNQQEWQAWIDADSPGVGSFTGCTWSDWYRPTRDGCIMNVLEEDYCVVCREQVVLAIHRHIPDLIVGRDPDTSDYIPLTALSEVTLSVDVLEPADEPLYVTWRWVERDEILAEGPGVDSLVVSALDLERGPWTITALVEDRTPWVIEDPFRLMQDRVSFFVDVSDTGGDDDDATGDDDDAGDGCTCPETEPASAAVLPLIAAVAFGGRSRRRR